MFRQSFLSLLLVAALSASAQDTTLPLGNGVDLTVVRIEPGTYRQGSPVSEAGRGADENEREVRITREFYLGKFPVTRGQFARFVTETSYRTEAEKGTSGGFGWVNGKLEQRKEFTWKNPGFPQTDGDPVVMVTWGDAKAFVAWLSRKTGTQFDLPTEAQWEYACRAGTTAPYVNAESADEVAWHKGNADLRTHPVGEKLLNPWGLGDMLGNVWEWCADWYGPYPGGPQTDPLQQASNLSDKPRRVLRGGSWLKDGTGCRAAARFRNDPQSRNPDNGFRVMAYKLGSAQALERTESAPPAVPAMVPSTTAVESSEVEPATPRAGKPSGPSPSHRVPVAPPAAAKTLGTAFGGLGCLCLGVFVLIFFIRRAFRGGGGSGGGVITSPLPAVNLPTMPSRLATGVAPRVRVVDDGFWVEGGQVAPGTRLQCRYTAGGAPQTIELRYEAKPEGQFVYTGQRPSSVSLAVVGAAIGESLIDDSDAERERDRLARERERDEREDRERERRRRGSSPSAY